MREKVVTLKMSRRMSGAWGLFLSATIVLSWFPLEDNVQAFELVLVHASDKVALQLGGRKGELPGLLNAHGAGGLKRVGEGGPKGAQAAPEAVRAVSCKLGENLRPVLSALHFLYKGHVGGHVRHHGGRRRHGGVGLIFTAVCAYWTAGLKHSPRVHLEGDMASGIVHLGSCSRAGIRGGNGADGIGKH